MVLLNRIEAKKLKKRRADLIYRNSLFSSNVVVCDFFCLINCLLSHLFPGVCSAFKSGCLVTSDFEAKIQWPGGLMKCLLHKEADTLTNIRISGPVRQVFKGTFYTDSME